MKTFFKASCILLVLIFPLLACQKQGGSKTSESLKNDSAVLATVNDTPITEAEIRFEIDLLPDELQHMVTDGEGLTTLLDDILKKEMLYQEAKKKNLQNTDEYKQRLRDLERRLMVEMLLVQEIEKNSTVTDQEVKDFYDQNRERFVSPIPGSEGKEEPVPFEEVKELIHERLLAQKQRDNFETYIDSLSQKYTVDINEDAIAAAFGISVGSKSEETPQMEKAPDTQDTKPSEEKPSDTEEEK